MFTAMCNDAYVILMYNKVVFLAGKLLATVNTGVIGYDNTIILTASQCDGGRLELSVTRSRSANITD